LVGHKGHLRNRVGAPNFYLDSNDLSVTSNTQGVFLFLGYTLGMAIIKVGILRGGNSSEYEVSLKTGKRIIDLLRSSDMSQLYTPVDIFIDKKGEWHIDGIPLKPEAALKKVDVIFNALHGENGEDGKIQKILQAFSIPFTGSNSLTSAVAMNKSMAKEQFKAHGIKTPYYKDLFVNKTDNLEPLAHDLFRSFPMPVVVKPRGLGSSIGVTHATNFQELLEAIDHARQFSPEIVVEEFISGKEIISGTLEDFRGNDIYTLMPVEVKHHLDPQGEHKEGRQKGKKDHIFDYATKQSGLFHHQVPAQLTSEEKAQINDILRRVHTGMGIDHYSSADFIVSPTRGVYLIEINTQPGLGEHSPFLKSLEAAGVKAHEFLKHMLNLAMRRRTV
jgi:D-alanine-D-alanine ligase